MLVLKQKNITQSLMTPLTYLNFHYYMRACGEKIKNIYVLMTILPQ